jgi:general secretion pathway protein J
MKKGFLPANNKGFTLLELLIAMGLSALVLVTVYYTYFSINRSIEAASEGQEVLETGRMLLELLKKDVRGIVPGKFPLTGKKGDIDGQAAGEMSFVTTAYTGENPLKLSRVGYALVKNQDGQTVLVRSESKDLKSTLNETATAYEVSRLVTSFEVSFYNGTEWLDQWDSGTAGAFPKQVRIRVDVSDAKGNARMFMAEEAIASAS